MSSELEIAKNKVSKAQKAWRQALKAVDEKRDEFMDAKSEYLRLLEERDGKRTS